MPTWVKKKNAVTKGSGHVAPGMNPAMTPAGTPAAPVPAPFMYVAKSATGSRLAEKVKINGERPLDEGSLMDIEVPNNKPGTPVALGDIVTKAIEKVAHPTGPVTGLYSLKSGDRAFCATGDKVALNVLTKDMQLAQSIGPFMSGAGFAAAKKAGTLAAEIEVITAAEPVAVATGHVVDTITDLILPGPIPFDWKRHYSSARATETSPHGRGGFTHSFAQIVRVENGEVIYRGEDARETRFPLTPVFETAFHRPTQQTLRRMSDEAFAIHRHEAMLVLEFSALEPGSVCVLRRIRDDFGNEVSFNYEKGRIATVVVGPRTVHADYTERGLLGQLRVVARGSVVLEVRYSYDELARLVSATDVRGFTERYEYDVRHRMVRKIRKNGAIFRYEYDRDSDRCVRAYGQKGLHGFTFQYEPGKTFAVDNPQARLYTHDARGNVISEATLDGDVVFQRAYDAQGCLLSESDGAGNEWTYKYDERGHRIEATEPGGVSRWTWENDRLTSWTFPDGSTIRHHYDSRGALVAITDTRGMQFTYDFDERGRLIAESAPDGRRASYEHNEEGTVCRIVDELGGVWLQKADALGRACELVDPCAGRTQLEHDAMGNRVRQVWPDGAITTTEYDALGCPIRYVDAAGGETRLEWSGTGVLTKYVLPDGRAYRYFYDVNERLIGIENPKTERYRFVYDRVGRVIESVSFDGRITRYQFTRHNRLSRIEYHDGSALSSELDETGCIAVEKCVHGDTTYTRDAMGRVLSASLADPGGVVAVTYARDACGLVMATAVGDDVVRYKRDAVRFPVERELPNGVATQFEYNSGGLLSAITQNGVRVVLERDPLGREVRRRFDATGVAIHTAFDSMHRPVDRWVERGAAREITSRQRYAYDSQRLLAALHDEHFGTFHYLHDEGARLRSLRGAGFELEYLYDAADSVAGITRDGSEDRWGMLPGNRLVRTAVASFEDDARGRRIRKTAADGVTEYFWDERDRLREVHLPDGTEARYTYDPFGRRIRKVVVPSSGNERVVEYVWDGDTLALERDTELGVRTFVFDTANLIPILQVQRGEVFAYVTDHVESTRALIDVRGNVVWSASYEGFGRIREERRAEGGISTPFRLHGQYHDDETGLSYARFRYFDPETGRWLTPDPLNAAGGENLYALNGNPTVTSDPLGLAAAPCGGYGWIQFRMHNGRVSGVSAIVTPRMLTGAGRNGLGSEPSGSIVPAGFSAGDARSHLLARMLGGPGKRLSDDGAAQLNLVALPQAGVNHPGMSNQEKAVVNHVAGGNAVHYDTAVHYPAGSGPNAAPSGVTMTATDVNTGTGVLSHPHTGAPAKSVTLTR